MYEKVSTANSTVVNKSRRCLTRLLFSKVGVLLLLAAFAAAAGCRSLRESRHLQPLRSS